MLIQNADRTTYGINKIVVFVLAFVVFFVVGFVSWQWDGVAPEPWRLRTLVLTPLTMSLLLYVCCDQFGVYYRCQTLWESIRRFVVAYACFVVLSVMIWKFFVPFSADVGVQTLAYLLTFLGSLWLRISRFRAEKRLVEEAPTLVVGTPDHVKEFRRTLENNHVDFRNGLLVMAPEELDSAVVRNLLIKNCVSKVVFLPEEVDSSVARCLVELCGKMGVDFYASMVVSMPAVHKTYFGVIGGTRMLVYKSTPHSLYHLLAVEENAGLDGSAGASGGNVTPVGAGGCGNQAVGSWPGLLPPETFRAVWSGVWHVEVPHHVLGRG